MCWTVCLCFFAITQCWVLGGCAQRLERPVYHLKTVTWSSCLARADLPSPKYFCPYSTNRLCPYFQTFGQIFCRCTSNQSKQNSVKGQLFYHSASKKQYVNSHLQFNTDTLLSDNFILFTSAKVVLDRRPQNTFSKHNELCVLLSLMPTCPFLNGCCLVRVCFLGFVHFSSSSSVLCSHLSPTASNSNPSCIGRWLTCVKFWCKVDVHWFNKLFGPIRTGHTLQPRKWLEICKCQWTITPHQPTTIGFAGNKLASFTSRFPYFLETLRPYFEKYGRTSVLPANFHTNTGKYGWVGRSAREWTGYVKLRKTISAYEDLLTSVNRRKLKWHGHVTQSSGLAKTVLQGTVQGGRQRGRQRKRWEDISSSQARLALNGISYCRKLRTARSGGSWL